jgi:hypothetical protein
MKRFILLLIVLVSITLLLIIPSSVYAGDDAVAWLKVNLPVDGKSGNWVLARGANIQCLTQAVDGTLYCYANPTGTTYTLFKSDDNGQSWSYTGGVKDIIIDIVTPQDNANVVYYATAASVYKSNDGAKTFMLLPSAPGGAGIGNVSITSVDVIRTGSYYTVAVATRDADAGEFGGVYLYDETKPSSGWQDTTIGSKDVYDVAFAPRLIVEQPHLIAVTNNEASTLVTIKIGLSGTWGNLLSDVTIPVSSLVSADVAFPDNYGTSADDFTLFIGLNSGTNAGDAYIIYSGVAPSPSSFVALNIGRSYSINNIDVTSIAIVGNSHTGKVLAGLAGSAQVYSSSDGGVTWKRSDKPPTGSFNTYVMFALDFAQSGKAYATTSGTESSFSVSADAVTWNQLSLINTRINTIVDVIPSPNYNLDNTIFVLTFGGKHSLWRSTNGGEQWERVFSSALPDIGILDLVRISPLFGENDGGVIFVTGTSNGNPVLWKSLDKGQSFMTPRVSYDPTSGATFTVTQCAPIDNDSLMVGCFDGTKSLVYRTGSSGLNYSAKTAVSSVALNSIALSPDYTEDQAVLVGNRAGWVYYSEDGGVSFEPLPGDATVAPLSGNVTVTFDPAYSQNKIVYAASDTAGKGIWRFVIGRSTTWENIDSTLPAGSLISSIGVSKDGTFYAANSKAGAGMERCLNPRQTSGPTFETIIRGLDSTVRMNGLRIAGNRLWAIDSANTRLLTFLDTLTAPVVLKEPTDEAGSIEIRNTNIRWEALSGATSYEWQADTDGGFSSVPSGFAGTANSTSARLPALDTATSYYWRVRATAPVLSPWSERHTFNTVLGGEVITPKLTAPEVGATVPLKPVLQWGGIAGAKSYELLIATDYLFATPVVEKTGDNALPTTAWQCEMRLKADTTYYWKIRASGASSFSPWSNIGVFITESAPVVQSSLPTTPTDVITQPPEPTSTTPLPSPQPTITSSVPQTTLVQIEQAAPEWTKWILYLGGVILIMLLGLIITVVIMLVKMSRYD